MRKKRWNICTVVCCSFLQKSASARVHDLRRKWKPEWGPIYKINKFRKGRAVKLGQPVRKCVRPVKVRGFRSFFRATMSRCRIWIPLKCANIMNSSHPTYYQFGQNVHSGNVEECAGGEQQNYASHVGWSRWTSRLGIALGLKNVIANGIFVSWNHVKESVSEDCADWCGKREGQQMPANPWLLQSLDQQNADQCEGSWGLKIYE